MIPLKEQHLRTIVTSIVEERESYHDYTLVKEDKEFIITCLSDLIFETIDKYVLGGAEHNPEREGSFVNDCDHAMELDKEVIDLLMYSRAARYKRNRHAKLSH